MEIELLLHSEFYLQQNMVDTVFINIKYTPEVEDEVEAKIKPFRKYYFKKLKQKLMGNGNICFSAFYEPQCVFETFDLSKLDGEAVQKLQKNRYTLMKISDLSELQTPYVLNRQTYKFRCILVSTLSVIFSYHCQVCEQRLDESSKCCKCAETAPALWCKATCLVQDSTSKAFLSLKKKQGVAFFNIPYALQEKIIAQCKSQGGEFIFNRNVRDSEFQKLFNLIYHSFVEQTIIGCAFCDLIKTKDTSETCQSYDAQLLPKQKQLQQQFVNINGTFYYENPSSSEASNLPFSPIKSAETEEPRTYSA